MTGDGPSFSQRRASYLCGLLALSLVSVGFGALSPALQAVQDDFGVGASLGALIVSGLGAGRLLAGFPAGVLVDRIGAGRVTLLGTLAFVLGSLIGWAASSFVVLLIGRFFQGVGLAVVPAGVLSAMMAGAPSKQAGAQMALYQAAITVGGAFGPAVGGLLAQAAGWRSALLFCAAAGVAAAFASLPTSRAHARRPRDTAPARARLGWAAILALILVMLPNAIASFDRFSVSQLALPLYASGPAGFDARLTGLLLGSMTLISLAMLAPAGWASDRFGPRPVVAASSLLTTVGILLMPSAPGAIGLWAATIVYAIGLSTLGVAGALYVFTLPLQSTGTLVGVYRLSTDMIQVVGPVLVGPAIDSFGFGATFFGLAAFGLLGLFGLLARTRASDQVGT